MKRNVAIVMLLGVVAIFSLIAMSPWLVVGPKRWLRSRFARSKFL